MLPLVPDLVVLSTSADHELDDWTEVGRIPDTGSENGGDGKVAMGVEPLVDVGVA